MNFEPVQFQLNVSEENWMLLKKGSIPQSMEQKWVIFYKDEHLNFQRARHTIFRLRPVKRSEIYVFDTVLCRRDIEPFYRPTTREREVESVTKLIELRLQHSVDEPWFGWDPRYPRDKKFLSPNFSHIKIR